MSDDFDGFNDYKREQRNKWESVFLNQYLPKLNSKYEVRPIANNGCVINTEKYGSLNFYPKAQSLYFVNKKQWLKKYGLKWIKENLI